MNEIKKEMTVPLSSVGADDGQSNQNTDNSIPESKPNINSYKEKIEEMQREIHKSDD